MSDEELDRDWKPSARPQSYVLAIGSSNGN
jgi:hypothetical protein